MYSFYIYDENYIIMIKIIRFSCKFHQKLTFQPLMMPISSSMIDELFVTV